MDIEVRKHDYAVISMYTSNELDLEVDSAMQGVARKFKDHMKKGLIPERSVGFFRADIEKDPDLDMQ